MVIAIAVSAALWVMPVQPANVVKGYSPPASAWGAGHRGVDLAASTGTWVMSAGAGSVAFVGSIAGKDVVTVRHGDLTTTYEPVRAVVHAGEPVSAGEVLGVVSVAGGHCGGYAGCMHWGLRRGEEYLNPLLLVKKAPIVLKHPR